MNVFLNVFQGLKNQVKVKLSIVSCPPVTTVLIKRPDLKFQLGFSVQNGIVSEAISLVSMVLILNMAIWMSVYLQVIDSSLFLRRCTRAKINEDFL